MKFKGNVALKIERLSTHDEYGQPVVSGVFMSRCSIVKLAISMEKTIARMSQTASLGNADEYIADAVLLIDLDAPIAVGDRLTVAGAQLELTKKLVRNDVQGAGNHWQVECALWA